ncbi:hypothetical protein L9F63_003930, partial [Diploptera punctata]
MDVFKIDQSLSANLGSAPPPEKLTAEVTFDAGSEFNLSFFDTPEDNSTQGFSDPGSVGSTSASSPPPQLPLPQVINSPSTILLQPLSGASNPGTAAASTTLGVKQGMANLSCVLLLKRAFKSLKQPKETDHGLIPPGCRVCTRVKL